MTAADPQSWSVIFGAVSVVVAMVMITLWTGKRVADRVEQLGKDLAVFQAEIYKHYMTKAELERHEERYHSASGDLLSSKAGR